MATERRAAADREHARDWLRSALALVIGDKDFADLIRELLADVAELCEVGADEAGTCEHLRAIEAELGRHESEGAHRKLSVLLVEATARTLECEAAKCVSRGVLHELLPVMEAGSCSERCRPKISHTCVACYARGVGGAPTRAPATDTRPA